MINTLLLWLGLPAGVIGLVVLSIAAPSVFTLVSSVAEKFLGPILGAIGEGIANFLRADFDGFLGILQQGKQILALITCCALTYTFTSYSIWNFTHSHYWLTSKTTAVHHPVKGR